MPVRLECMAAGLFQMDMISASGAMYQQFIKFGIMVSMPIPSEIVRSIEPPTQWLDKTQGWSCPELVRTFPETPSRLGRSCLVDVVKGRSAGGGTRPSNLHVRIQPDAICQGQVRDHYSLKVQPAIIKLVDFRDGISTRIQHQIHDVCIVFALWRKDERVIDLDRPPYTT